MAGSALAGGVPEMMQDGEQLKLVFSGTCLMLKTGVGVANFPAELLKEMALSIKNPAVEPWLNVAGVVLETFKPNPASLPKNSVAA
jgi:hypothetical protein